jgi:hypothetical protein
VAATVVLEYANDVVRSPDEDVEFEREIPGERREILHQEGVVTSTAIREYLLYQQESALLLGIVTPDDEVRLFTSEDCLERLGFGEYRVFEGLYVVGSQRSIGNLFEILDDRRHDVVRHRQQPLRLSAYSC